MIREVGKTKEKPLLAGFPARNKQSPRGSAGNHNGILLNQHFKKHQKQRWQRNTTSRIANKSNGKPPKTSGNYLLLHFSPASSTRKIRTRSSFSKVNVFGGIKTKCVSKRKDFPFCPILGKAHERSGKLRNREQMHPSKKIRNLLWKKRSKKCWRREQ